MKEPYVRVADYGRGGNVRTIDPEEIDPGDVEVQGKQGAPGDTRLLTIGADDLSRCAYLDYSNRTHRFTLAC